MPLIVDSEKCTGCMLCQEICPTDAIRIGEDGKPYLKYDECWYCLACEVDCPTEAIRVELPYKIR